MYQGHLYIVGYSEVDLVGVFLIKKSTSSYCVLLGNLISGKSKKLAQVRMKNAALVIFELVWVKNLMIEIRYAHEN